MDDFGAPRMKVVFPPPANALTDKMVRPSSYWN